MDIGLTPGQLLMLGVLVLVGVVMLAHLRRAGRDEEERAPDK